ncbi:hypothetical protein PHISCL_08881 [Aspergillus sclerotialis]|uniref:DUF7587 domain-containing protein n=1 Tax=Aspergillus sclerotialis TaxID=2070753 RepID=A0A3A2Z828_9EURO|nr:hypothetical protein PHISCL_08881 [Aspergillus sclerotialis]
MDLYKLTADKVPFILFRACIATASFSPRGDLYARRTIHGGAPTWRDFECHLSWARRPTGLLSFSSSWRRAMRQREILRNGGENDIVVIAVWAKDLAGVYSAEDVASKLGYPEERARVHRNEYLVEGGIAADEYRILAVFEGGGTERDVVFECPFYKNGEFFPGRRSNNALDDIEGEIYRHSGVRDDMKRDELVKAIMCWPSILLNLLCLPIQYSQ